MKLIVSASKRHSKLFEINHFLSPFYQPLVQMTQFANSVVESLLLILMALMLYLHCGKSKNKFSVEFLPAPSAFFFGLCSDILLLF